MSLAKPCIAVQVVVNVDNVFISAGYLKLNDACSRLAAGQFVREGTKSLG